MPIWVRFFFTLIFLLFFFFILSKERREKKKKKKWNLGLSEKKREGVLKTHTHSIFFSVTLKTQWRERPALWQSFLLFFSFWHTLFFFAGVKQKLFKLKSFLSSLEGEKRFTVFFWKVFLCWKELKFLCNQKEKLKLYCLEQKAIPKHFPIKLTSSFKHYVSSYIKRKREVFFTLFFSFSLDLLFLSRERDPRDREIQKRKWWLKNSSSFCFEWCVLMESFFFFRLCGFLSFIQSFAFFLLVHKLQNSSSINNHTQ